MYFFRRGESSSNNRLPGSESISGLPLQRKIPKGDLR